MHILDTQLTRSPYVFQICQRLGQLEIIYSRAEIEACLAVKTFNWFSKQTDLSRHIDNIMLTYIDIYIKDAFGLMGYRL